MSTIFDSMMMFLAEISLILGAVIILILGTFNPRKAILNALAIFIILFTLVAVINSPINVSAFNAMFNINSFVKFAKGLICLSSLLVLIIGFANRSVHYESVVLILLSTTGMLFFVSSNSLLSLYISLELMSLPIYILSASDRNNSISTEAGLKYFILGAVASGIFLMGITFIYGFTGSFNFQEIYNYYVNLNEIESVVIPIGFLVGLILIIVGLAFKISAVPFHMWTPDIYQGSPTIITTYIATASKIAALIGLIKLLFDPFAEVYLQWQQVLMALSIGSMFLGSIAAVIQNNFKRLLAYSSIGHIGFILAGIATAEYEGLQSALFYMAIYLTTVITAFTFVMLTVKNNAEIIKIEDIANLARSHPGIAFGVAIILFSMAGIPPMAGFFSKFYILLSLAKSGMYIFSIAFVIASVISAYYYIRIIQIMYFSNIETDTAASVTIQENYILKSIFYVGVLFNATLIFWSSWLIRLTETASFALLK